MAEIKSFDFTLFSDKQIVSLMRQVYAEVKVRREKTREAREQQPVLTEATGSRYRNPANASQTWSGRGQMPQWMREALTDGHDLASLLEVGPETDR